MKPRVALGVDLGMHRDATALVAVEQGVRRGGFDYVGWREGKWRREETLVVRMARRVELGTRYREVAGMVAAEAAARGATVVADATGLGRPVMEMLREAGLGGRLVEMTLTGGEAATRVSRGWHVPRRLLLTRLRCEMEQGRVVAGEGAEGMEELGLELMETEAEGGGRGRDDLVMALAMAVWELKGTGYAGENDSGRVV